MIKKFLAICLVSITGLSVANENYRFATPSVAGMAPKTGKSFSRQRDYTYSWMPNPSYLDSFVDADYDYPSQGTGRAYNN